MATNESQDRDDRESVSYTLRNIPIDLYRRIKARAERERRSIHMQMQIDLQRAYEDGT